MASDIHPIFDKIVSRTEKEAKMQQQGVVLWLTGLSGSGKSTLATAVERQLFDRGYIVQLLDGDNIRTGLNSNLSFTTEDRVENIRRIAETAKLFCHSGIITICSFISPLASMRAHAKAIIGANDFHEIYVKASLETCESRDPKQLYRKARAGIIPNFTGLTAPYEIPENPFSTIITEEQSVEASAKQLMSQIIPLFSRVKG